MNLQNILENKGGFMESRGQIIYTEIIKKATYWRFLIKYKLDENQVRQTMSGLFKKQILKNVEGIDYSIRAAFIAYQHTAKELFDLDLKEVFLHEIYQYTLSKSFKDAVTEAPVLKPVVYELFLIIISVFSKYQKDSGDQSFMNIYPLVFLEEEEIRALDDQEYSIFKKNFENQNIYELLKLHYEVYGRSTIEHILGVHHLAMHLARQLIDKGIPVDLGRVSGAAAGHDIGKYGCHPDELDKIAYYHYYYTYQWFSELNINYIKNVAVYHSTWDLELESLSVESLILIYADFCVKRSKNKPGKFMMKFLTVDEAFDVILSKLDNVDQKKKRRYERVYQKLNNFKDYLCRLGISVNIENYEGDRVKETFEKREKHMALESGMSLVNELKDIAIEKSILLMHKLRHIEALNEIIQNALSEKNIQMLRRYLFVFEEYSTYLTPKQKLITMDFLSDYLMHSEEDIRKECSTLIGKLLAYYDEHYTKELPKRAKVEYTAKTKLNKLHGLLKVFLIEDTRLTPVKRERQIHSYLEIIKSLFSYVDQAFKIEVSHMILSMLDKIEDSYSHRFMVDVLPLIMPYLTQETHRKITDYLIQSLNEDWNLTVIRQVERLYKKYSCIEESIYTHAQVFARVLKEKQVVISPIFELLSLKPEAIEIQDLYLSNLKSAVSKSSKEMHIDYLYHQSQSLDHKDVFYTAMHFCNILKVSAYESVRHRAGNYLIKLFNHLNSHEKNDIVIELLRALEIEGYGFTRHIPNFVGGLIPKMGEREYKEILNDIEYKLSNAGVHVRVLLLSTLSHMIQMHIHLDEFEKIQPLVSMIFKGFFTEEKLSEQITFNILCKDLIGNDDFDLETRFDIFKMIYKKLNVFISEIDQFNALNLLNYSVGLKYVYRFITEYSFKKEMIFVKRNKIAFYPGTFDPFSLGQKAAAVDANSLGFDVFIALSEFHWRRRTQPSLTRRRIVEMSIADQLNIFAFPQSLPINFKIEDDLNKLRKLFVDQAIYIVIGEDTLLENHVYTDTNATIYDFPHIIYKRKHTKDNPELEARMKYLRSDVIVRTLADKYEMIDVAQIRRNIDHNWDAYDVMDDLASRYIKNHNLYKNEPQYKSIVSTNDLRIDIMKLSDCPDLTAIVEKFNLDPLRIQHLIKGTYAGDIDKDLVLERNILRIVDESRNEIVAFSIFCKAEPKHLFNEIRSLEILDEIAHKKFEKILVIDYIGMKRLDHVHALDQIIITETLVSEIQNGYQYAVVKCQTKLNEDLVGVLVRSGFVKRNCTYSSNHIYSVDMSFPVIINLDGTTRMKAAFRQDQVIRDTIKLMRSNLQQAVVNLYPGQLLLSFDRSMIYNHMIRLITTCNGVSMKVNESNGSAMCVPYGDVFKRWLLPNTVTKALHTERYYSEALDLYEVDAYPGYLSLEDQTRIIKAYNMPVMLVDDLLDKGKRFRALEPYFECENVQQVIVGILTGRGKDLYEGRGYHLETAYYLPRIRVWFNEADLYPYLGGDSLKREGRPIKDVLYSANLMLPFSYPKYIKGVKKSAIYDLSLVCLENAKTILHEIEKKYLELYKRNLTISDLREVMITPRVPDAGDYIRYDRNQKPSLFLENAIEQLKKMEKAFKDT